MYVKMYMTKEVKKKRMLELLELELHVGAGRRTPFLCKSTKYLNHLSRPKQVPLVQRALDPLELVSTGLAHYTWNLKLKQFQVRQTTIFSNI